MEEYRKAYLKFDKEEKIFSDKAKIYENIRDLEYEDMFGTKEYNDEIKKLIFINEAFDDVISLSKTTTEDKMDACIYIKNELFELDATDIDSLIYKSEDTSIRALFNYLFFKSVEEFGTPKTTMNYFYLQDFYTLKYQLIKNKLQMEIGRYALDDINRALLTIIQEAIEDSKNEDIKFDLIEAKYKLIFLNKDIEDEMIYKNFKIGHSVPTKSRMMHDLLSASEKEAIEAFSFVLDDNIEDSKLYILELPNEEHENSKYELVLRSCYLRANLFYIQEEGIIEENIDYYEEVASRDKRYNHSKSDKVITDSFTKALKDKRRYHPTC